MQLVVAVCCSCWAVPRLQLTDAVGWITSGRRLAWEGMVEDWLLLATIQLGTLRPSVNGWYITFAFVWLLPYWDILSKYFCWTWWKYVVFFFTIVFLCVDKFVKFWSNCSNTIDCYWLYRLFICICRNIRWSNWLLAQLSPHKHSV